VNVPLPICLANPRRAFVLHDLLGGLEFPDRDAEALSMRPKTPASAIAAATA
jgi:hypothetical protein